jgi:hypothetical protein
VKTPNIPVSWGELIDKITILEIKYERLRASDALKNVQRELTLLQTELTRNEIISSMTLELKMQLKKINESLWEIEDSIRDRERSKCFDESFIQLARSVYINNDERARIKKEINTITRSALIEEKGYTSY